MAANYKAENSMGHESFEKEVGIIPMINMGIALQQWL